ncbi:MAG: hypothetical protein AAFR87_00675 [Bacteroidota bacterium]
MKYSIGIRREDLSKKGEERVAISPSLLQKISQKGNICLVQSAVHPKTGERKRRFKDQAFKEAGASIQEDLSDADFIFGLKEIEIDQLLEEKTYFIFSHTHKGQIKNRPMLQALVDKKCSLVDYELITHLNGPRVLTAFTYFAGYAGMADSLWTLDKRSDYLPPNQLKQSVDYEDMGELYETLDDLASQIEKEGTNDSRPPLIIAFLGNGKTSTGAQEIIDRLPSKEISLAELQDSFENGSRKYVYKLVLDIPDMYRLKASHQSLHGKLSQKDLFHLYLQQPELFESNMDQVYPYCSMWMNCIIWSNKYPRLISREQAKDWYRQSQVLEVIGDITCDPEGAIQFSAETWIDEPVFIYNPLTNESNRGFDGTGFAVMAVTNLPCEFPADASTQFSENFEPLVEPLLKANFHVAEFEQANLPPEIANACILWKGKFTPKYAYMQEYLG